MINFLLLISLLSVTNAGKEDMKAVEVVKNKMVTVQIHSLVWVQARISPLCMQAGWANVEKNPRTFIFFLFLLTSDLKGYCLVIPAWMSPTTSAPWSTTTRTAGAGNSTFLRERSDNGTNCKNVRFYVPDDVQMVAPCQLFLQE